MLDSARIAVSVGIGSLILMCDEMGLTIDDHRQLCERLQRLKGAGSDQSGCLSDAGAGREWEVRTPVLLPIH